MLIDELSDCSDSEMLELIISARNKREMANKRKTNRFGTFKKMPRRELDNLVKRFQLLVDDIKELEARCGFENREILNQVLKMPA